MTNIGSQRQQLLANQKIAQKWHKTRPTILLRVPKNNKKPVLGSKYRILTYDEENGKVIWEGKVINEKDPIPEI